MISARPKKIGGSGTEPSPGDLLLGSLAACKALSIKMVARALRIELTSLEIDVLGDIDHRGVMMVPGAPRIGFTAIRCKVRLGVAPGTSAEAVQKLQMGSELCCAITDTIRNATDLSTTFDVATP